MNKIINNSISIIGGAGHVGFPLGLAFASKKYKINFVDLNKKNWNKIKSGIPPFFEIGAKKLLKKCLKKNTLSFSINLNSVKNSKFIVICIGTPVNKNLKPDTKNFISLFFRLLKIIKKGQIIIIRSSVYPGIIHKITHILKSKNNNVVYCPERIVQSKALIELPKLPQIIAGTNKLSITETRKIFKKICRKIIITTIEEAELIKLFSNANRYINFAIANQLYMICKKNNLDFSNIRNIMREGYERNLNLQNSGFTAGPCLLKDTMQLSAFYKNKFSLGVSAMKINEGFPELILRNIKKIKNYKKKKVGVLGLSFKAETDDIRDSLSIKLLNKFKKNNIYTLQSDQYYENENNISKDDLIKKSDIIVLGAPHKAYKKLKINQNKIVIDVWGFFKKQK